MKIQESAENYLETILILGLSGGPVRSVDIANEMGFSKPSVSIAMKNLRLGGYVRFGPSMHVELTPSGREIAERMYERHVFLTDWLSALGVDPAIAARDACKIEHALSVDSFAAIKGFARQHPVQ
ncbi:MAG: metal-dependent transcriptional regulator [Oscillospiraceae bacterium]|nr:metal-dependent transcriptional regulator [Oscillospiraceae bacterium]